MPPRARSGALCARSSGTTSRARNSDVVRAGVLESGFLGRVRGRGRGGARGATGAPQAKPGTALNPGDFSAARIRPGVAGVYAWRLETLGRDGDFGFFPFATEAGARAALELLEGQDIVSRPDDEAGQPTPPPAEDFEEARRRYEESERALALDAEDDARRGDDHGTSDRR